MTPHQRIDAAIHCMRPDRVPIVPIVDFFAARYKGVPPVEFATNGDLARDLLIQVFDEFGGWDATFQSTLMNEFGYALALPVRIRVPGKDLPDGSIWQFDRSSPVMTVEDYDYGIAHGWQALWERLFPAIRPHTHPDEIPLLAEKWIRQTIQDTLIWETRSVPTFTGAAIALPFEIFAMARSFEEFNLDLSNRPGKVMAAIEAITPGLIEDAIHRQTVVRRATQWGYRTTMIFGLPAPTTLLWPDRFEMFAWLSIKQIALALIANGITPLFHLDSDWSPMLESFRELPRGTCVLQLDGNTDIFKAKRLLGNHMCLMGDVPADLLKSGATEQVSDYVKRLIDVVGVDGGFILSTGCHLPVEARAENLYTMIETGKSYGVYH